MDIVVVVVIVVISVLLVTLCCGYALLFTIGNHSTHSTK